MLSNHLILCYPLLLLPSIFPSIRVFSNELALLTCMVAVCTFLMIGDAGHLPLCLSALRMSSLEKCLISSFACFLNHLGFFFAIGLYGMTFNGLISGRLWLGLDPQFCVCPLPLQAFAPISVTSATKPSPSAAPWSPT